ncbi:MAG: non-hydrolyzing UDP-N-acetylglucosamine 2-epimerase [Elusimicrobiota bacterium]
MINRIKIVSIVGARPQFIKASAVSRAMRKKEDMTEVLVHTGQHYDDNMSEVFFKELEIKEPDYNLGIGGGSHGQNTGRMIERVEAVLIDEEPDWVLIYGDTDSTLAGALAAAKLCIPIAHVEAGLRSFNRRMPEEINRILSDQLSTILFCPTEKAIQNLKKEGFPHKLAGDTRQQMINVGDVMYDAAIFYSKKAEENSNIMQRLKFKPKDFVLATIHREENTDDPDKLRNIIDALNEISEEIPVVFPLHPRTRIKLGIEKNNQGVKSIKNSNSLCIIEPVSYLDMFMLEKNAKMIITDSGGVQKEAYFHGIPCLTVRDETEWVELVKIGANRLSGTNKEAIIKAFKEMKNKTIEKKRLYGYGDAAEKIVSVLYKFSKD